MRQRLLSCVFISATLFGCQSNNQPNISSTADKPSFDQWVSTLYQEQRTGLYIVDWDVPVASKAELRRYYDRIYSGEALTVYTDENGNDIIYDEKMRHELTYCVSTSFGEHHDAVVQAIKDGTADWMNAADVRYIYMPELDKDCTAGNTNVWFDVNPASEGQFIARGFFPNSPRDQRNVLVDDTAFTMPTDTGINLHGVLVHELGHTLGLRHEHVSADINNIPFENWFNCVLEGLIDQNFRIVNEYDSASTMHYPQCGGTGNLQMTQLDREGIAMLYGPPKSN